ncbi:MAG: glycosyltransferase, partial [Deltaproteobacteria bacterium]|nr:glycosyltransferase [Deltaproteobacteria bacterium]
MIISQFYPLLGGAEVQAQLLASSLIKRGMKVSVFTRKLKGLPRYELMEGIPVYRAIRTIPLGALWGMYYMISVFLFLYRKRNEYDIIHCHIIQEFQTIVAVLIKYFFNKKVIVKMSSSGETSDFKVLKEVKFGRLFLRWIRNVDAIISVCKKSSEE